MHINRDPPKRSTNTVPSSSSLFVAYIYARAKDPKNITYRKAFLDALPIFASNISSLILYMEKYEMKPRNPMKPAFPSTKYSRLSMDRKPRYQNVLFIIRHPFCCNISKKQQIRRPLFLL